MNFKQAAIIVENRLGLPSSERLRVLSYCVSALLELSRKLAGNRQTLPYVLTDRETVTAAIQASGGDGFIDLAAMESAAPFLLLDVLRSGKIYLQGNNQPCSWISPVQSAYSFGFPTASPGIYLKGKKLFIQGVNAGTLAFELPAMLDITKITKTLENAFIDKAVEQAAEIKTMYAPDYAQDGAK